MSYETYMEDRANGYSEIREETFASDEEALIAQLKATADELESVWKHLSRRPNIHVEAARNLIARIELQIGDERGHHSQSERELSKTA